MTFYLKYRPQTIAALDLTLVRQELGRILSSGRFAHAYLFSGPRGTGKTSAARILAKIVNCKRNEPGQRTAGTRHLNEPCNVCVSCKEITQGSSLDIFEIDAASNRGIDDIRELRERIKLAPVSRRYKVYIIDEVHMLTTEAFNALLKTLEEPPLHALFILCTTEPEKLPQTVVSRCTRIAFPKATVEEVVLSLAKVVRGEKLSLEPAALRTLAEAVDGSFRDAMKYLEQLSLRLATHRKKISLADVREVTGSGRQESVRRLLLALAARDSQRALGEMALAVKEEVNLENYTRDILEKLRLLLLGELGIVKEERIEGLELASIKVLIALFSKAAVGLRTAVVPQLPLELAIVEWLETAGGKAVQRGKIRAGNQALSQTLITSQTRQQSNPKSREKKPLRLGYAKVLELWPMVLKNLRPKNHSLEALLKAARPLEITNEQLVLEVAYPFHKQQLELARYKTLVEAAMTEVFSGHIGLRYVLRKKNSLDKNLRPHENISGAVEDEEIVRVAEEIFGGKET